MKQVRILSTTDIHGHLDRGLHELPVLEKSLEADLLIDCGDFLVGSPFATFGYLNAPITPLVTVANELAYDVMVPGNHDLDYGLSWLKEQVSALDAEYVCANLVDREDKLIFEPYAMIEKNSVKIAVIGLMTHGLSQLLPESVVTQVKTRSPYVVLGEILPEVSATADIVVVAYHGGLTRNPVNGKTWFYPSVEDQAYELIANFPAIDSLICGHQHFKNVAVNGEHGTAFIQPGAFGETAGYQVFGISVLEQRTLLLENRLLALQNQNTYRTTLEIPYQAWLSSEVDLIQLGDYIEQTFDGDIYLLEYEARTVRELAQELNRAFPLSEYLLKGKELQRVLASLSENCAIRYVGGKLIEEDSIYKVVATPQLVSDSYLRKNMLVPLFSDFMTR